MVLLMLCTAHGKTDPMMPQNFMTHEQDITLVSSRTFYTYIQTIRTFVIQIDALEYCPVT